MEELITDQQAEWLVTVASLALLVAALVAVAVGRGRLADRIGRRGVVLLVASGPLIYALWRMDAAMIGWLGFDTLLRLGVELAIFVALGLAIGLWLRGERTQS